MLMSWSGAGPFPTSSSPPVSLCLVLLSSVLLLCLPVPRPLPHPQAYGDLLPVESQPLDPLNPSTGIQVSYKGGICQASPGQNFTVQYQFKCATTNAYQVTVSTCFLGLQLDSAAACGVALPNPSSGGTAPLSAGWVFVILVFVAGIVYVGAGMAYKRVTVGASGIEAVPNVDFWRAFGANITLGWTVFTHAVTCRPLPNVTADDDMLYHGIRGDDYDGVDDGPTVKRIAA